MGSQFVMIKIKHNIQDFWVEFIQNNKKIEKFQNIIYFN